MPSKTLTHEKYIQLKERQATLKRLLKSYTFLEPDEVEQKKLEWKTELTHISKIIKDYEDRMIGKALIDEKFGK